MNFPDEGKHREFDEVEELKKEMDKEFHKMFKIVDDDLKRLNQNQQ